MNTKHNNKVLSLIRTKFFKEAITEWNNDYNALSVRFLIREYQKPKIASEQTLVTWAENIMEGF